LKLARGRKEATVEIGPVEGPWDLPDDWRWERLESVAPVNPRRNFVDVPDDAELVFLGMAAVKELTGKLNLTEWRPLSAVKSGFTRFFSGDVIFAKITPCMENGKLAIIPDLPHQMGAGSTEFHVMEPQRVSASYLFLWLSQRWFRKEAEHNMTGTAGQKHVPTEWLRQSPIPVPPPEEQCKLVSRIEALFADVEKGELFLDEVGAIEPYEGMIGTLRQSILAAAFRGRLTQ
jgi:type I restriction enzyme, S subunit